MEITKQQLKALQPAGRLKLFISQTGNTEEPVKITSLIGTEFSTKDLIWLAWKLGTRHMLGDALYKFSCDCALANIDKIAKHTFEAEYITNFLKNPKHQGADWVVVACRDAIKAAKAAHDGEAVKAATAARDVAVCFNSIYTMDVERSRKLALSTSYHVDNETVNKLLTEMFSEA